MTADARTAPRPTGRFRTRILAPLASFLNPAGETRVALAPLILVFWFAFSLPPKWVGVHVVGLALVAAATLARRTDWRSPAMRTFLVCTVLWLAPVLLTAAFQNVLNVPTAIAWRELPILTLRMLGVGIGLIVLLQRGWLTLRAAMLALLAALSIHAVAGLVDFIVTPEASLVNWRALRINGLVFNPNPFGMFMALTAVLSVGFLIRKPRNVALWALLILALLGIWTSGSRGAILTAAAGMAVLFPPASRRRLLVYLAGVALAVAVAPSLMTNDATMAYSDSLRVQIAEFTLEHIRQAPWLGWGIGAYEHLPGHVVNAPHNMWLDLALSSGIMALAGALVSTGLLAYRLYRRGGPAARLALATLAAAVTAGTLEYSILDSTHFRGVWVILTALACYTLNPHVANANRSTSPKAPASSIPT